jgi:hypothetical protein
MLTGTRKTPCYKFGVQAVEELRNRGLAVVGLWKIKNLPNFSNGRTFDPESTLGEIPVDLHPIICMAWCCVFPDSRMLASIIFTPTIIIFTFLI